MIMFQVIIISNFILFPSVLCQFGLDDFINPSDLELFSDNWPSTTYKPTTEVNPEAEELRRRLTKVDDGIYFYNMTSLTNGTQETPENVDCFGLGSVMSKLRWILNLKPQDSSEINVEFYFSSRKQRNRTQVLSGNQFGLEWVDFKPHRHTVVIVHGFLSYSKAEWIINMTNAYLDYDDVNVITVDWSRGGNTWKYWRAVANTRTVGTDLANFLQQVMNSTGTKVKDFHFIGHSLGAHICSFASNKLGRVRRITGLDPAQPCFITTDLKNLLDKSDADFVDVIHTNGRKLAKLGLGVPNTCGHQDFYPNGGMKQPGCHVEQKRSFIGKYLPYSMLPITHDKLMRAMCNHGRSYLLFTESLKRHNCSLIGRKWNLSYKGVNDTLNNPCSNETCPELGINSIDSPARGSFYVMTSAEQPFCIRKPVKTETRHGLLSDLKVESTTEKSAETPRKSGWFSSLFGSK